MAAERCPHGVVLEHPHLACRECGPPVGWFRWKASCTCPDGDWGAIGEKAARDAFERRHGAEKDAT